MPTSALIRNPSLSFLCLQIQFFLLLLHSVSHTFFSLMVILEMEEDAQPVCSMEMGCDPRISFSAEFLEEGDFISICPKVLEEEIEGNDKEKGRNTDFEFLASKVCSNNMLTADELFFEGKLLPYWQIQQSEKLKKISFSSKEVEKVTLEEAEGRVKQDEPRVSWFVDDDPSPRPPKCTVLWKELLRLKKQRASSLSPSSSSSSTSSSSSSMADVASKEAKRDGSGKMEKHAKRIKKGLERTRSASIRIRPMISVPICTQTKSSAMPPFLPLRRGRLER